MNITRETKCRVCGGELETALDLGEIYLSGFVKDQSEATKAPLALSKCKRCELVQLRDTVDLDGMYRQYWYMSSLNKSMVSSLQNIVDEIKGREILELADDVVDIGCNDGTLLGMYDEGQHRYFKTGFDPALNLSKPTGRDCDYFINDYFTAEKFWNERPYCKAKVITAIAMFYDLPDPIKFTKDVASILADDGIFVVQFTDLLSMFKATAFDNICHEHLEYYRLKDVINILDKAGLEPIDVSYNKVNGGSVRVTAAHKGAYSPSRSVEVYSAQEDEYFSLYGMKHFIKEIEISKIKLNFFLDCTQILGETVYLLGASTKGNTLLQVCGVTKDTVLYAAEVNKDKFGLRTVGSDIEIISEDEAFNKNPTYFLVPVWHFEDSLVTKPRIKEYIQNGGKLIFPLPKFHVRDRDNVK
jgi:SAM-dependent methyltransferase